MRNIAAMRIIPQMDANASLRTTFCAATSTTREKKFCKRDLAQQRALSVGRNAKWKMMPAPTHLLGDE